MNKGFFFIVSFLMLFVEGSWTSSFASTDPSDSLSVPEEIRFEATLPNDSSLGRPLPLAGHWNTGSLKGGFTPKYQMQLIEKGHHLLPWFQLPDHYSPKLGDDYYKEPLRKASDLDLPISLSSTQWERPLTDSEEYLYLPPKQNPNVVGLDGQILKKVSPFSPLGPWREVGKKVTSSVMMKNLQEWYPSPPLVVFVSNNEHTKLKWTEAWISSRYRAMYGRNTTATHKRKAVGDGWITHYRALQDGMREGLIYQQWKKRARFIGYNAIAPNFFGRWSGWEKYSLHIPGRLSPWSLAWDGASPPYYVHNWNTSTDFTVHSPQIQSMNWVFMLEEAYRTNPNFWFELSMWDGHQPSMTSDKRKFYQQLGQTFNPDRYGGMVQFGMWLLRPRVVREFRNWTDTVANSESYFLAVVNGVDRVYANPTLKKFWRHGQLVANLTHQHPYQEAIPEEYQNVKRWFLLDTNLDPPRPWKLNTELPVFSIARVLGAAPNREWIVYAFSPLKVRKNIQVSLPGYGFIHLDPEPAGTFYHIMETSSTVHQIVPNDLTLTESGESTTPSTTHKPTTHNDRQSPSPPRDFKIIK